MLKKVSKNTVAAQVITQLTDLIRGGSLRPGDRLPSEREMSEQLGVSRPPIREALRAIEYAGIIETRYGDGIYVKSDIFPTGTDPLFSSLLNQYTLEEMIEMRKIIELASVKLAIERATDDDVEAIREAQRRGGASLGDMDRFIEYDFAFHSSIAETSRNSLLFKSVKTMRTLMSEFNHELLVRRSYRENVNDQHALICDALERRDTAAAVAAMDSHLMNVVDQAMGRRDSAGGGSAAKSPAKKRRR